MSSEAEPAHNKRKRLHAPEDDALKAKKPDRQPAAKRAPSAAEACRAEIRAIYKLYEVICDGEDGPQELAAFQQLIDRASKGEPCMAPRLDIHLLTVHCNTCRDLGCEEVSCQIGATIHQQVPTMHRSSCPASPELYGHPRDGRQVGSDSKHHQA
jgi:hypothetical protein